MQVTVAFGMSSVLVLWMWRNEIVARACKRAKLPDIHPPSERDPPHTHAPLNHRTIAVAGAGLMFLNIFFHTISVASARVWVRLKFAQFFAGSKISSSRY